MALFGTKSSNSDNGYEALLSQFRDSLPPEAQANVVGILSANPDMTPAEVAALMRATLGEYGHGAGLNFNQQSIHNEAALLQGGYDPTVANAVSASVGIGADTQAVQHAAADFARDAARAITNGQPLNEVRTADPNLSLAAQEAIYEQIAKQQGTSLKEIEERAAAAKAADMQAIQGAVFGLAGMNEQGTQGPANKPSFGNLMWGQASETVVEAQPANPFASLIAGLEISRELRNLNAQAQAPVNPADSGQFSTQLATLTQQRGNDGASLPA